MNYSARLTRRLLVVSLLVAGAFAPSFARWVEVDYSELVDRRQLSHSGEPVGVLLDALEGRALGASDAPAEDRLRYSLLDPLLEPYAFILRDVIDSLEPGGQERVDLGSLWLPGSEQPAWVELLRARRVVADSDGAGAVRLFLPVDDPAGATEIAAKTAWDNSDLWLGRLLAAERMRLKPVDRAAPKLNVAIYPYVHEAQNSKFRLGATPYRFEFTERRAGGTRPPLDLNAWDAFLKQGWVLEGARLDEEGSIRLFGSPAKSPPTLFGRPISLSDMAVAYRAIFHGGLAEPYMSLDRGFGPQTSVVNYGGRLRDTSLGWVSLLCDIRFKTFSMGIDIATGRDVRAALRKSLPDFRTHIERFAIDPASSGVMTQQTRLWFYPDSVDLTLSNEGDVLVLRRVRMSAASERVEEGGTASGKQDPPWTRATVKAINDDYATLAKIFPEMEELDHVVRLLSLFTWLKQLEGDGRLIPELDALLDVTLPARPTPRVYPQLLAFNALPPEGDQGEVRVYDRVEVGEALDRLSPPDQLLSAERRYRRAIGALDGRNRQNAELLNEVKSLDVSTLDEATLDFLAYRAERLRMHQTVLGTLPMERRRELLALQQQGSQPRVFSVGIGGLDLDMGSAVSRAAGKGMRIQGFGGASATKSSSAGAVRIAAQQVGQPRDAWRVPVKPRRSLPVHGESAEAAAVRVIASGDRSVEISAEGSIDLRRRAVDWDGGMAKAFDRIEAGRRLRYRLEAQGDRLVAKRTRAARSTGWSLEGAEAVVALPEFAAVRVATSPSDPAKQVRVRFDGEGPSREADLPRDVLQRLLFGPSVDRTPDRQLPGFSPLPPDFTRAKTMMVLGPEARWNAPWENAPLLVGEEDPVRIARALTRWWRADEVTPARAVVGVDLTASPARWTQAAKPKQALLWMPRDGVEAMTTFQKQAIQEGWGSPGVETLPASSGADLIVLVSAEGPAALAERIRSASSDPALKGKLLAVWPLAGGLRGELPAELLKAGQLAGVGLADGAVVSQRDISTPLRRLKRSVDGSTRVEALPGPFLWYF